MKHLIVCFAVLCLTTSTLAADCNSAYLTASGLAKLAQPTTVSGLRYCKNLQAGQSCCSADVVNTFQDKSQTLINTLTSLVTSRDKAMVEARDALIPAMKESFSSLQMSVTSLDQTIALLAGLPDPSGSKALLTALRDAMQAIVTESNNVYNNLPTIKAQIGTYQKARTTCVVELVKIQASAWCLACDPNYANRGVSGTTVTMSTNTCNRVQSACYDYLVASNNQNGLLFLKNIEGSLNNLVNSMATAMAGMGSPVDISTSLKSDNPQTMMTQMPGDFPSECKSATDCAWICTNFLSGGDLTQRNLIMGGAPYASKKRLLVEVEEIEVPEKSHSMRRQLQGGKWEPSQDESGVTVTFQDDPGNVGSTNAGLIKVSFACFIGLIVTLFF